MDDSRETGPSASDQELVSATKAGDRDAFEELVKRHRAPVYGLALHFLRDPEEADEAAQEAFVRAYQLLGRYDNTREFGLWLKGIAAKVCTELRRRRWRVHDDDSGIPDAVGFSETDACDTVVVVREALKALPDKYRIPLVMFYLDEASVVEVAYALGLSQGAVRVRLHRGREMLRERLSSVFGEEVRQDGLQDGATTY